MNRMKHLLCCLLLMTGVIAARAEIIIHADTESTLKIAEVRSMTFDGDFRSGNLVVNYTDGTSTLTPIASIQKITFRAEEHESEGIREVKVGHPTIAVRGDMLLITAEGGRARVVCLDGRLVSTVALTAGATALSLASLPAGIYIIDVNGESLKLQKK